MERILMPGLAEQMAEIERIAADPNGHVEMLRREAATRRRVLGSPCPSLMGWLFGHQYIKRMGGTNVYQRTHCWRCNRREGT